MTNSIFDFPVTGVYSGLQLVNQLNAAFASLITNNAGTTPPADPVLNQFWYDTTTGTLFLYNGTTWVQTAFGAPFVGVQIVSGGVTVTPDQFGTLVEAQGQSTYDIALPNPSDYVGVNTAVFSNINTSSPVTVATVAGSILGTGSSGSYMRIPYGSLGLFVSDGYNWLAFSNAGYALLGGASTQTFDVAPAASAANAIPLAQAQTTFAGIHGNSSEVFAAANASAAQDVVNLGQAENLFPQLSGDNTFTGDQTIQGTIAVPANAGEITGGSMPSGATAAWVQAAFSSAYAGLIQNYYLNGAQVYSLSSAGDIVAHSAALTSGSIGSLTVTGAATVPDAMASDNPVALGQTTNGSLSPTFDNITTGTQTTTGNQTVNGELIVSGATNAQSATFTSLTAGSGAFTALQSNNITGIFSGSLSSSSFNTLLGGTISAGTILAAAGTAGNEVVNYTQMTNSSLAPSLGNTNIKGTLNVTGATSLGGLVEYTYDIGGQRLTYNTAGLTVGWNFTNGGGEVDLLLGPAGAPGGLHVYQLNSSGNMVSTTPILALTGSGNLAVTGTASAAAGTSGTEVVNYAQMTDGSLTPKFYRIKRNSSQESQNWLPNSTFLFGFAGWQAPPAGIYVGTYAGTPYAAYAGTDPSLQYWRSNPISAEWINPGEICTLSGWVYNGTSSGDAYLIVECFSAAGIYLSNVAVSSLSSGAGWTYLSTTEAFPAETASVQVGVGFQGASSGSNISFSMLKFEAGTIATLWDDAASAQLFQNGQFSPEFDNVQINGTASASAILATNSGTLTGPTAGSVIASMPEQGVAKKMVAYANGYENNTTTAQTVPFPTAFSHPPVITTNTTGLTLVVSTTELTINAPNSATAHTGLIIVEGI